MQYLKVLQYLENIFAVHIIRVEQYYDIIAYRDIIVSQ